MQQETNTYSNPERKKPNYEMIKRRLGVLALTMFVAGAGVGVGLTKGIEALSNANVGSTIASAVEHAIIPHFNFSKETKTYTVNPGEGLYNAIGHIDNISSIPMDAALDHVRHMPENKDTLADGLQAYETVVIPDRVDK